MVMDQVYLDQIKVCMHGRDGETQNLKTCTGSGVTVYSKCMWMICIYTSYAV